MPFIKIIYLSSSFNNGDYYDTIYNVAADTPWHDVSEEHQQLLLDNVHHIPTGRFDKAVVLRADDSIETTVSEVIRRVEAVKAAAAKREATRKAKECEREKVKAERALERKRKQLETLKKELEA